jgi:hypothetical protein
MQKFFMKKINHTGNVSFNMCLKLRNGDLISGTTTITEIKFSTRYGLLTLPVKDLMQIDFGIIASPEIIKKIDTYVDNLQTGSEKVCKETFKKIIDSGISALAVLDQYLDTDKCKYEEYGVLSAYNFLKNKFEIDEFSTEDTITLSGNHRFPGISNIGQVKLKTEFG